MKKIKLFFFAIIVISVGIIGCAGKKIEYLEPEIFMERARTNIGSAHTCTYIGTSQDRVYFEHMTIALLSDKPYYIVYWTDIEDIPKEFIDKLETEKKAFMNELEKVSKDNK